MPGTRRSTRPSRCTRRRRARGAARRRRGRCPRCRGVVVVRASGVRLRVAHAVADAGQVQPQHHIAQRGALARPGHPQPVRPDAALCARTTTARLPRRAGRAASVANAASRSPSTAASSGGSRSRASPMRTKRSRHRDAALLQAHPGCAHPPPTRPAPRRWRPPAARRSGHASRRRRPRAPAASARSRRWPPAPAAPGGPRPARWTDPRAPTRAPAGPGARAHPRPGGPARKSGHSSKASRSDDVTSVGHFSAAKRFDVAHRLREAAQQHREFRRIEGRAGHRRRHRRHPARARHALLAHERAAGWPRHGQQRHQRVDIVARHRGMSGQQGAQAQADEREPGASRERQGLGRRGVERGERVGDRGRAGGGRRVAGIGPFEAQGCRSRTRQARWRARAGRRSRRCLPHPTNSPAPPPAAAAAGQPAARQRRRGARVDGRRGRVPPGPTQVWAGGNRSGATAARA